MQHKLYKKVVLVILDGFGIATYSRGNAIALSGSEVLNFIVSHYPSMTLQASGPLVGLPWGEMGNSEVGHLNIGAGRIVGQDLPRINAVIQNGQFFNNPVLLDACHHVKQFNSKLHLLGMVSPGGVHSLDEHVYALLGLAKEQDVSQVFIHMFTDGRDTAEKVAMESIQKLRDRIAQIGCGQIASITGRFYAMDRGEHWDQTSLTYQALVEGKGEEARSAEDCILQNYNQGIFDEMIKPTVITQPDPTTGNMVPVGSISDNDAVIFFNFRPDRGLQLTQYFVSATGSKVAGPAHQLQNLFFVTMTEYLPGLPVHVAFPPLALFNNLASVVSKSGHTQFHIAESEKYAHVTSFFNGGNGLELPGEERVIVTSPDNALNYSDHPEMSAEKVTDVLVEKITKTQLNFFVANFANTDMVGHTGNLEAGVKAVKFVERCLQRIMEASLSVDGVLVITADHGNIEQMINVHTGEIDKDHTTNPVPFLLIANEFRFAQMIDKNYLSLSAHVPDGVVSDIAPTILALFGLPKPPEMTAINLLDIL